MLSSSFLEPYRKQHDPFKSLLARSTYLGKYSRNAEAWTDTIARVVLGSMALDPRGTTQEAELLFDTFWHCKALPPGRGLYTGGVSGMPVESRNNCFSGSTRFWTDGILKPLKDLVGQSVTVLCHDGQQRSATVESFGRQGLWELSFRPSTSKKSLFRMKYRATANHRWITTRGVTDRIALGDRILVTPRDVDKGCAAYKEGFLHGLVYGDGTAITGREKQYQIRLCGEKAKYRLVLCDSPMYTSCTYPPSYNGDPLIRLRTTKQLKCLPDEEETLDYQAGFVDGWIAMDGHKIKTAIGLTVSDAEGIEWIRERAPLLGYCITGQASGGNGETNYGRRKSGLIRLTLVKQPVEYELDSFEEVEAEEVFCVVEPETRSFTLEGGFPTGNCYYATLRHYDDWCWVADMLMCGGGVGVGLHSIGELPVVERGSARLHVLCSRSHPDKNEVMPDPFIAEPSDCEWHIADDSRRGWIEALRAVFRCAFSGKSIVMNVSSIRKRGAPIKTFGGISCGPAPLTTMLRQVWGIIRAAQGRKLGSVECLDVTNHIGVCIKSGNVRRSALIVLGNADDQAFRDAKKDWQSVMQHRHSSNNSIVFETESQIDTFDWVKLVEDNAVYGEPGILNLWKIRQTDPGADGVNPCGEQPLHDREACNLSEIYPALMTWRDDVDARIKAVTRYTLRQRLEPMVDRRADLVRRTNMRIGVGLGGICDFTWEPRHLRDMRVIVQDEAVRYADELDVVPPIACTTVKPSGTISLLNGSSPGIHAPFAPFYIRRTRIAKNEPMAEALVDAGVRCEPCMYDSTGNTLVFSFPMKAINPTVTVQNQTAREQIERQVIVQKYWADNAVSSTISFKEEEKAELAALLEKHAKDLKSISCLPSKHGYGQPPYEAIDEWEYQKRYVDVNHDHPLTSGGDLEVEDCPGGVCPVR